LIGHPLSIKSVPGTELIGTTSHGDLAIGHP
jgi:hypothetical protein